jgi:hypothetical protein
MLATAKTYLTKLKNVVLGNPSTDAAAARHPERFNSDGTPRLLPFYDSAKYGPMKGTNPEGAPEAKDSRQVRRRKIRVFLFNQITAHPSFGIARREVRRYWARKGRLQPPQPQAQ